MSLIKQPFILVLILILGTPERSIGEHILFLHPVASPSHLVVSWPLVTALYNKGHQITVISPVKPPQSSTPHQNVTVMHPKNLVDLYKKFTSDVFGLNTRLSGWTIPLFLVGSYVKYAVLEALLSSPEVNEWLESKPNVDLIISDVAWEFGVGIARQLNSKVSLIQVVPLPWDNFDVFGVPFQMVSSMENPKLHPLGFLQRVEYVVTSLIDKLGAELGWIFMDKLHEKYLSIPGGIPKVKEMARDISLVFHNGHPVEEHRKSLPPNFISLPGLHIVEKHNLLSQEIEQFIGKYKGFIYISFGTVVNLDNLPDETKSEFFSAIREFPEIAFLWKWDQQQPKEIPDNLMLQKWFKQQDVFGHEKILGVVTQAGRPSLQEAMYNSVPTITFPVQGDQDYNAMLAEELGVSIRMEFLSVTKASLVESFQRLVNKEFSERCHEVSSILKDVPMNSVDKGVYWIEYLLRHDDTSHLRPLAAQQSFFVRSLLDVWLFLGFIMGMAALCVIKTFKVMIKKLWGNLTIKSPKVKTK